MHNLLQRLNGVLDVYQLLLYVSLRCLDWHILAPADISVHVPAWCPHLQHVQTKSENKQPITLANTEIQITSSIIWLLHTSATMSTILNNTFVVFLSNYQMNVNIIWHRELASWQVLTYFPPKFYQIFIVPRHGDKVFTLAFSRFHYETPNLFTMDKASPRWFLCVFLHLCPRCDSVLFPSGRSQP